MGVVSGIDEYQRRHSWLGFPLAVIYKYGDDQGGYLAALITYYGFLSLFPLLLLLVTFLGYALRGNPHLQQQILHSALGQFPIVGEQIGRDVHAVNGSVLAVVIGVLSALYGGIGVAQATQNAFNIAWAIPKNSRLNPVLGRLRSLGIFGVLGVGLLLTTGLSALSTDARAYTHGAIAGAGVRLGLLVLAVVVNVLLFIAIFRLLTSREVNTREILVGAIAAGIGWQLLQTVGTFFVAHELKGASASYGTFGIVLGLIGFIYLAANLIVLCTEANVVRANRLWPRSLLTPFTDRVRLTPGDRRAYQSYAAAQRSKGFQEIHTTFHDHTEDPVEEDEPAAGARSQAD